MLSDRVCIFYMIKIQGVDILVFLYYVQFGCGSLGAYPEYGPWWLSALCDISW